MDNIWILAQTEPVQPPSRITSEPITSQGEAMEMVPSDSNIPATGQRGRGALGPYGNLILLGLMFAVMYLILFRGPRKKQQQHTKMVQSLEKNDRVRTIGGIIGTVVDIKGDEVTLKVDEANNTKIKFVTSAIGRNLTKDNK